MQDTVTPVHPALDLGWRWRNAFEGLGGDFHSRLAPTELRDPYWIARSQSMARELGLQDDWWQAQEALEAFAGNRPLWDAFATPSLRTGMLQVWAAGNITTPAPHAVAK